MKKTFKPKGICASKIDVEVEDGVIKGVSFTGGCPGNLEAVAKLVTGMNANYAAEQLKGIVCGRKGTSCSDQLAIALETMTDGEE